MTDRGRTIVLFASWCIAAAISLAFVSMISGFGTRWQWWGFRTGLSLLRWTVYGEIALMLMSLSGILLAAHGRAKGAPLRYLVAFLICVTAISVPVRHGMTARSVPPIHDITTDTESPPQFKAILPLRKDALNPTEYGGPSIAEQQRQAYPDIVPLTLDVQEVQAFDRARSIAHKMGWEIINVDPQQGIIEATDTTFWFGFKDDIVIRVSSQGSGSRIDIRSLSRVGKSDVGANARRIRAFLKALKAAGP
jgi:uncharacterized protein (DUF1499 family)